VIGLAIARKISKICQCPAPDNMIPIRVAALLDHQLALYGWKRKIVLERGVGATGQIKARQLYRGGNYSDTGGCEQGDRPKGA
jgi:hypothetical protein